MQEIQIYATASETVATVRDYANAKTVSAPSFVLGVSAKIRLSLFANPNNLLPLPKSELANVVSWSFVMDTDFDTSTAYKIVADNANIVLTGADTDGEKYPEDPSAEGYDPELAGQYIPTVFVIPIPNMNSTTLNEWLGTAASKGGLIGELVGYDSVGSSIFVLQIENFTVRNRITGTGEPSTDTADEYLTLNEARALFLNDSNATRPYIDFEGSDGSTKAFDGRYVLYEAYWFRTKALYNVYVIKDKLTANGEPYAFIQYSDELQGWALYPVQYGTLSARYLFPWKKNAANPGPLSGYFWRISNPSGTDHYMAKVTQRYNIEAHTY